MGCTEAQYTVVLFWSERVLNAWPLRYRPVQCSSNWLIKANWRLVTFLVSNIPADRRFRIPFRIFFSGFNFTAAQVVYTIAMIIRVFVSFSSVQIYDLSYIHLHSSPTTYILRTLHRSVSHQSALHRYRKGHWYESRSGLNFFSVLISQLLKLCV